jgi:archaeal type IV pilus assembly protein PilA
MDESAVSEAIGVILIVALTVILAAIIAAYAFGLAGGIPENRNLIISVDKLNQTHIIVMYRGGQDQNQLESLKIYWPSDPVPEEIPNPEIGKIIGPRAITPGTSNHVVVVGLFSGAKEQVLIDTFV